MFHYLAAYPKLSNAFVLFSPTHLPPVMPLNALHRLLQTPCSAMLMIRVRCPVLMKYDAGSFSRILRIMDVPYMSGVSGHNGYIIITHCNNAKIAGIQSLQILCAKQPLPPSSQTMPPVPAPQLPLSLIHI